MRNLRNLPFGFGFGGVELGDGGGGAFALPGGGGVRGTFCGGIEDVEDGIDDALDVPVVLGEDATEPGGAG